MCTVTQTAVTPRIRNARFRNHVIEFRAVIAHARARLRRALHPALVRPFLNLLRQSLTVSQRRYRQAAWPKFSFLVLCSRLPSMRGRLLLIVTSGPHAAPMVGAARTTKENSMSTVLTISTLQSRSDLELQNLLRKARYDLECTATGSAERRDALATLENITLVMRQRAMRPRGPGF
jgi:hypothetical protein